MADRPIVILHGWSDRGSSFRRLAGLLRKRLGREVASIDLADYATMDDEVTYDDLAAALTRAWGRRRLPMGPRSVDAVVHSTGALVLRDWLVRNFGTSGGAPVHRLLMLAPANFGSPLAHKGNAFLGRVTLGWSAERPFQTGDRLLRGLELASPYTWELARRDRRGPNDLYGPGRVLCTVLVGNAGYDGIRAAANEDGGDGTVRVSTANMDCAFLEADFSQNPGRPTFRLEESVGSTAFRILPRENHSTIAGKDDGPRSREALEAMVRALTVEDDGFEAWRAECAAATAEATAKGARKAATHGFQNTVFLVEDQFGRRVPEYFLEFFVRDDDRDWFAKMFHREALRSVHAHSSEKAFRSLYVDCTVLGRQVDREWEGMTLSLSALPDIGQTGSVGYRSFTDGDIGGIEIPKADVERYFRPHRTLMVRLRIRREQAEGVFGFTPLPPAAGPGPSPAGG
ncbi:MAG: alpha/beta hydrolase [Planctomycetaceae bacterium]|nr:alpha/beta hydrolase [Planctomycetaceae bacterium]